MNDRSRLPVPLPVPRIRVLHPSSTLFALFVLLSVWVPVSVANAQLTAEAWSFVPGDTPAGRGGEAVAVGDFNGDGFDDLAVGMPLADSGSTINAGRVRVSYGGVDGIVSDSGADQIFTEGHLDGGGVSLGDRFGAALAAADFDMDGFDDLVVGIPGQSVSGEANAGKVGVVYGSATGLDLDRTGFFNQNMLGETATAGDEFGFALAAGPLGLDDRPDLAVGVPGEDVGGKEDAGAVHLIFGAFNGLTTANATELDQDTPGAVGEAEAGERLGSALAIGEVTGDQSGDLIIGIPRDEVSGLSGAGSVYIIPGGPVDGIVLDPDQQIFNQATNGLLGDAATDDDFGADIALGDYDGDGDLDLAIGAPGESQFGPTQSGVVHILFHGDFGVSVAGDQIVLESLVSPEISPFDRFGDRLASGDFDNDGRDDLAVGMPLDNVFGQVNSGNVAVLYGTPGGPSPTGAQLWNGFSVLTLEIGDELGAAIAAGHFSGSGGAELAIGVPGREVDANALTGGAVVLRSLSLFEDDFEAGSVSRWGSVVGAD